MQGLQLTTTSKFFYSFIRLLAINLLSAATFFCQDLVQAITRYGRHRDRYDEGVERVGSVEGISPPKPTMRSAERGKAWPKTILLLSKDD